MKPQLTLVKPELDIRQKISLQLATASDELISQILIVIRQDELKSIKESIFNKFEKCPETMEDFFAVVNTDKELALRLNDCTPFEFTQIMSSLFRLPK